MLKKCNQDKKISWNKNELCIAIKIPPKSNICLPSLHDISDSISVFKEFTYGTSTTTTTTLTT